MPSFRFLAPALFAVALGGAPLPASAQSFSDVQRGDIEAIVRNYLIAHPEVLEEAMAELSKRQAAAEAAKHEAGVASNAGARRRNEGIGKSLCSGFRAILLKAGSWRISVRRSQVWAPNTGTSSLRRPGPIIAECGSFLVALLAGQRLGAHNVVSFDPSRRPDREARFGA